MAESELEALLALQIRAAKLPEPKREFAFCPTRRWRFDFCYPDKMLAIECDGGTWKLSGHTSGKGHERDCEKRNEAVLMGYRVLTFSGGMIKRGEALRVIEKALA